MKTYISKFENEEGLAYVPSVTVTDTDAIKAEEYYSENRVDAQDVGELRRMTCPAAYLLGDCPRLKLLSEDSRRRQLFASAHDLSHATIRRNSDDVDGRGKAYWLKAAKSHILGGYQTLKARLSAPRDPEDYLCGRHVTVEYDSHGKKKSKSSDDVTGYYVNLDSKEEDHNLSSCLAIHSLKEGKFIAEISLLDCPPNDDIIIRIKNYRLEILMQKRSKKDKKCQQHTISQPYKCGAIDIPIYVDPSTITFELVDEYTLVMEGVTKSSLPRRICLSQGDLNACSSSANSTPKKKTRTSTTWYTNNQLERPALFRQRSYTR